MMDSFNKNRNVDGYIDIDSLPKKTVARPTYGSRKNKLWFESNGELFLFKPNFGDKEAIREVLNEELAKKLGIRNAEYDIGMYQGQTGVISKNFISQECEYLLGFHLFCEYNLPYSNDLYTYYQALIRSNSSEEVTCYTVDEMLRRHILDMCTAQNDRHHMNIAFYKRKDGLVASPRFDSAGSFLSINKLNKMQNFTYSSKKDELIKKYRGDRTKFRILPGSRSENSVTEFYEALDSEMLPTFLRERMTALDPFISRTQNLDLLQEFYILEEYGIKLSRVEKDFYRAVYDYKAEEIEQQKVKRYTR